MGTIEIQYHKTPVGEVILGAYDGKLCLCDWRYRKMRDSIDTRIQKGLNAIYKEQSSEITEQAIIQLDEYFSKARREFNIPLLFVGTDFQKTVWNALLEIPYGTTESYAGLSRKINNPSAIRAVSSANGANSISIIVPCHRVIGSNGDLTGFAGGLTAKKKLLDLESALTCSQASIF